MSYSASAPREASEYYSKKVKGSENVCTVETHTGTCMCVQWFMVENGTDINLSSHTSLTTIPIYVTWWFMERKWKQSGSVVCMSCCACLCAHRPSDFTLFLSAKVLMGHFVCSASFKFALDALPQLHSGADKKWVSQLGRFTQVLLFWFQTWENNVFVLVMSVQLLWKCN